jgi:hypothetical protein
MASDISLAVGGGARRMTYAEPAGVRWISLPSARRLVLLIADRGRSEMTGLSE